MNNYRYSDEHFKEDLAQQLAKILELPMVEWYVETRYKADEIAQRTLTIVAYEVVEE